MEFLTNTILWKLIGQWGLPIVEAVALVAFLIWVVKHNFKTSEKERQENISNLNHERELSQKALDDERKRHQEFLSSAVKGLSDSLIHLTEQNRLTTEVQYKLIDTMTQYTTRIENAYERLEKGNRAQYEEHVKHEAILQKMTEALLDLHREIGEIRKELAYYMRKT